MASYLTILKSLVYLSLVPIGYMIYQDGKAAAGKLLGRREDPIDQEEEGQGPDEEGQPMVNVEEDQESSLFKKMKMV